MNNTIKRLISALIILILGFYIAYTLRRGVWQASEKQKFCESINGTWIEVGNGFGMQYKCFSPYAQKSFFVVKINGNWEVIE